MKNFIPALLLLVLTAACNEQPQENSVPDTPEETIQTADKVQELTLQIRKSPKNASLYKQRAEAYLEESMLLLALEDIDRALLIDSTSADFHALKGDIQYMNKAPDKAVRSFERALELDPENTDALLKMAEIQLLLRQYQKCFDYANRALRVNEQLYMAYFIKGYAHFELGDSTLFVSSVQTALEL